MMANILLVVLGLLLVGNASAQSTQRSPELPVISFLTADGQLATQQDSGAYCVETYHHDSIRAFKRVYHPSGPLARFIPYANIRRNILHGCYSSWYTNGQLNSMVDYVNGERQGKLVTYYPNGMLKRREYYTNGRCNVGNCYDSNGYPIPYFTYEQLPLYPGGNEELLLELRRALRLSADEQRAISREGNNIEVVLKYGLIRRVELELQIAPDGRVAAVQVVQSNAASLNQAAIRAVAGLRRQFIPGRRDGIPVVTFLTVPIEYNLAGQNRGRPVSLNQR